MMDDKIGQIILKLKSIPTSEWMKEIRPLSFLEKLDLYERVYESERSGKTSREQVSDREKSDRKLLNQFIAKALMEEEGDIVAKKIEIYPDPDHYMGVSSILIDGVQCNHKIHSYELRAAKGYLLIRWAELTDSGAIAFEEKGSFRGAKDIQITKETRHYFRDTEIIFHHRPKELA